MARIFGRESEERGRGLKGPIHHALDTLEIEAGEGVIAIAIEDWLSNTVHTHNFLTQRQTRREIGDGEGERVRLLLKGGRP